ncbi:MAG: hypothetical protein IPK57_20985 [Chitinophagaceae bacterium]|nr:hypothetical protein [Chitinophagaceae bacterium]
MRIKNVSSFRMKNFIFFLGSLFCITYLQAQQTSISDYILFGGKAAAGQTPPAAPGYGVQIGSSCFFTQSPIMGSVGSYKLVKTTGNIIINGNIYSGETIQLANGNEIRGNSLQVVHHQVFRELLFLLDQTQKLASVVTRPRVTLMQMERLQ